MKYKALFPLLATICLIGCTPKPSTTLPYQALTPSQNQLANRIQRYGILTHQQGTQLWVTIPTDSFFAPGSTELFYDRIAPIADVATLVNSFQSTHPNSKIRVMSFKNPRIYGPSARNSSKQYAKAITQYLQSFGVTHHIKIIQGTPKSSPTSLVGDSFSRRVIISVNASST